MNVIGPISMLLGLSFSIYFWLFTEWKAGGAIGIVWFLTTMLLFIAK